MYSESIPASDLSEHYFDHSCLELELSKILPVGTLPQEEHKVSTVAFQMTPGHATALKDILNTQDLPTEDIGTVYSIAYC